MVRSGLKQFCKRCDRAAHKQQQGRPCGPQATDISGQIGQMTSGRAPALLASFAACPEPAEFIEGVHHASDRSRRACLYSCARANVHMGCHPICRLSWCLDRHQPPAGRPLSKHLREAVLFSVQPEPHPSGILVWSMMERLGAGPPWNSSASAMRGASLCRECGRPPKATFAFSLKVVP